MECPHILSECKINRELIKTRKCQLIDTNNSSSSSDHKQETSSPTEAAARVALPATSTQDEAISTTVEDQEQKTSSSQQQQLLKWKCSDCQSSKDNWICLHCGSVLCGRYDNGHALQHFQKVDHKICINTLNFSVYCYQCDDFVVNETPTVEEIRQELKGEDDSCSETSYSSSSSTKSSQHQETASVSSTDSGWEDTPKPQIPTTPQPDEILGRKLRPRKRTHSNEAAATTPSSGSSKSPGVSPSAKRKKGAMKVVGLRNLGNTCFMNSVLQSLSNIKEFSHYFNALPSLESPGKAQRVYYSRSHKENSADANVVEELRKVLISLSRGGDGSKGISPECLFHVIWKVVPQFRGHRQHDAHEFLRYMLDRLHTELQHVDQSSGSDSPTLKNCSSGCGSPTSLLGSGIYNYKGGRSSIVTNVFGGTLQSEVRCLICGMESKKHDPFLDLSLDIPEKYYKDTGNDQAKTPDCNISDCLSSFTEVEELAETELYYCSSCKCKQRSTKRFWIRRLPNVLCLHIKRFRWNNFFRTKLDLRITFPIKTLDMSQYVLNHGPETRRNSQSCNVYDLAAVIVHHGNGSSCGHYTSFAINNGNWLHFNDHTVKEVPSSQVLECKPYILFYIRRDTNTSTVTNSNQSISKNL